MKSAVFVLMFSASALASPTIHLEDSRLSFMARGAALATTPLSWTGIVLPDEPKMKFIGTAEEIYNQIIKVNPNYDSDFGVLSASASATARAFSSLDKRSPPTGPTSSDYHCSYGTYVDVPPIDGGIQYLYNIGTGDCAAPAGTPGAGGCSCVSCSAGAGIWLCNDEDFETHIPCQLIADNAVEILIKCQYTNYVDGGWSSYVRGQIFSVDHGWNTIINSC